jgi:hypothetical protein
MKPNSPQETYYEYCKTVGNLSYEEFGYLSHDSLNDKPVDLYF